jgi:anti-sigma B factor antagonist
MELIEEKSGKVLVVIMKGRLDASTYSPVEKRILELIQSGERYLVLDLGSLEYISSIGLRVLMVAAKRLKSIEGEIIVCDVKEPIKQVFDISGFVSIFRMLSTREEAIRTLSKGLDCSSGGGSDSSEGLS